MIVPPGWVLFVFAGLALIAIISAIVWDRRPDTIEPGAQGSTAVVRVTLVISSLYAASALLILLGNALAVLVESQAVWVDMPVETFFPMVPEYITLDPPPPGYVVDGGFTSAEVGITGLTFGTRLLIASGSLVSGLVPVALAALVALLCLRLVQGRGFGGQLSRYAIAAAVITLVCGLAGQALSGWGASAASYETLLISGWSATGVPAGVEPSPGLPSPETFVQIEFWPLLASFGLASVAVLLRYGARLEKDAEGLV